MKLPHRRQFLHVAAGAAALPAVSRFAWAQAYPTRPVRIIVGFGAGFSPDIVARLVGQRLSERLGQQFVVENRPGAAGNLATEAVVRAPPDGYTLLLANGANAVSTVLYEKLSFDFIRDIAPVASIARRGKGSKIMAIVDRHGLPLSVSTHAANRHEVRLVRRCFDFYMIKAKPENLIGDRAYDSDALDEELRREGIEMIAPHRSNRVRSLTLDRRRQRR